MVGMLRTCERRGNLLCLAIRLCIVTYRKSAADASLGSNTMTW